MRLAIVSAIAEEISAIYTLGILRKKEVFANREFLIMDIHEIECILTTTQVGKVAAASTVSALILHYSPTHIIVIGTAGALHPNLAIGDVVIGDALFQHDVDLRPLRPRFELGIKGKTFFESDDFLTQSAMQAAHHFIKQIIKTQAEKLSSFNINNPKIEQGLITSGDIFLSSHYEGYRQILCDTLPKILAVEMEGAAIAQVCHDYNVPFTVIRCISDKADHSANVNFSQFLPEIAAWYGKGIIENLIKLISPAPIEKSETTSNSSESAFIKVKPSAPPRQSLFFTQPKVSTLKGVLQQWTQSVANLGIWTLERDGQNLRVAFNPHQKDENISLLLTQLCTHLSQLSEWQKVINHQQENNSLLIQLQSEVDAEACEAPLKVVLGVSEFKLSEMCVIN